jgi:hypothetical protein
MENFGSTLNLLAVFIGATGSLLSGIGAILKTRSDKKEPSQPETKKSLFKHPIFLLGVILIVIALILFALGFLLSGSFSSPKSGDFEKTTEGWGDYPEGGQLKPDNGVNQYCDKTLPIKHTGNCSLLYQPTVVNQNAYVARFASADDTKTFISVWVYVPSDKLCSPSECSTARVVVWDNQWVSHEGEFVSLNQVGKWVEIKLDLKGVTYPQPYQAIGVHFFFVTQYSDPLYIDTVTVTKQ